MSVFVSRSFILTAILITVSTSLFSQTKTQSYISPKVETTILTARSLEPELTIDIFLKLIERGEIKSKTIKRQLLEEAFYLSFNVKYKVRLKIIPINGEVLTVQPTFVSNAHNYKLNTLSLQTRIVKEILKVDDKRGYDLFNQISRDLPLDPLSCNDYLLYEVDDFYELTTEIAKSSFNSGKIKEGERLIFLTPFVENMKSPSQISPISKMLSNISLTEYEMSNLISVFSKSLGKISNDNRSFSYFMNSQNLFRDIYQLSRKFYDNQESYDELRLASREFLISNLQGIRCEDFYQKKKPEPAETLPFYVAEANKVFFQDAPITFEDIKPQDWEKTDIPASGLENQFDVIKNKLEKLRFWEDEKLTGEQIKEGYDWQEEFLNALESVSEIKSLESQNDLEIFHRKCLFFRLLLREASKLKLKEQVIRNYLQLLKDNSIQKNFASEWFLEFDQLRNEIHISASNEEKERIRNLLENSNITAVTIYLEVDKTDKNFKQSAGL